MISTFLKKYTKLGFPSCVGCPYNASNICFSAHCLNFPSREYFKGYMSALFHSSNLSIGKPKMLSTLGFELIVELMNGCLIFGDRRDGNVCESNGERSLAELPICNIRILASCC